MVNFSGYGNTEQIDFCIGASSTVNDLNITILPFGVASPGFESGYRIVYENMGTTSMSGQLTFQFDETKQGYINASQTPVSTTSNTLTFDFTNIGLLQNGEITVKLQNEAPPTLNSGDVLALTAEISDNNDYTPEDNTYVLNQTVVNSYDPNDNQVLEGDEVEEVHKNEYLHYMVRFQNTGTANAQKVVVKDTLSDELDWNTLRMVSASSNYSVQITNDNQVEFIFENIDLPFESADEEGSHGYISYKIKPKEDIAVGDVIEGNAAIYFDYNEPIITNTVSTEIVETLAVATPEFSQDIQLYPNPTSGMVNLSVAKGMEISKIAVYDITGKRLLVQKNTKAINLENFSAGIYFVTIMGADGAKTRKKVIKK